MISIKKEWRETQNYPGYYVSNYGEVYSKKTNKILRQSTTKQINGYKLVWLSKDNNVKGFLVHRLVYELFVGVIPTGFQINHLDENKHNNRLDNLDLVTPSENTRYGTASKRRVETTKRNHPGEWSLCLRKPCINVTTGNVYPSISEAARQVNGNVHSISNVCCKKRKTYRKEIWSYYEGRQ